MRLLHLSALILICFALMNCSSQPEVVTYRGELITPGGSIVFPLTLTLDNEKSPGFVVNQSDTSFFTSFSLEGDSLTLSFDHYESHIRAVKDTDGNLTGRWWKLASGGLTQTLPFRAFKGASMFEPSSQSPLDGEWSVTFTDSDEDYPATGIFSSASGFLDGTFRTETGDYRFLRGETDGSTFTLSTFDAAHAFFFKGELADERIKGEFWSASHYYATFKGSRGDGEIRDPSSITKILPDHPNVEFSFPDEDGNIVTASDNKFNGKALVVYVFGSWCPNCADETKLLRQMWDQYKDKDVEFIGIAHEYSGDFDEDVKMVRRYRKRFDIPWTLLIAGTDSKAIAAEQLPFVKEIVSFPTSFYADKTHKIMHTHTGFNGPGTGVYYQMEIQRFKNNLNAITESN